MTLKPEVRQPRVRNAISKKNLLWALPLAVAVLVAATILALPGFVSSDYHRATIEALAASLTGRNVHINGKLSLALLPHPQFIAGDITITSPDNETITAASLTLDLAVIPLLHGQISARAITLQSPHIVLPWPLPGGAAAIEPPPWLTTLHAQINNGEVSLGAVDFTHVSADIFTAGRGSFSISGNGNLASTPVTLSLGFGAPSAAGATPVTLDIQTDTATKLQAHIAGAFDASSTLTGNASFSVATLNRVDPALSQPLTGTAAITADPAAIRLSGLAISQGQTRLAGTATLALPHPALNLLLTGENLNIPTAVLTAAPWPNLPTHLTLDAINTTIAAQPPFTLAHLQTSLDFDATGTRISSFTASRPDGELSLTGKLDATGKLQAKASFGSTDMRTLIDVPLPAAWASTHVEFSLNGTADALTLAGLTGNFGPAKVTGAAVLAHRQQLSGQLHFDQIDLDPFIAALRNGRRLPSAPALTGDFEITADHASLDRIPLTHLLTDARLGRQLVVRQLSASVYGGIAAASFTLSDSPQNKPAPTGDILSARAILALPSGAPLAALLPAALRPPAVLTKAPLAISFLAAGSANQLATSASLTLGNIGITASPVIDLIEQTAHGAFTLRHPNAIKAFKAFGLNAGLAWPGAGSIALRANVTLSPTQMGFSDFVLSMGDLTGNGALIYTTDHQLHGQIDADTLALPPLPAKLPLPWTYLTNMHGKIGIAANRILVAGSPILGPSIARITLSPGKLDLALTQADLAGGTVKGDFSATLPAAPGVSIAPAIVAKFALTGAAATAFNLPVAFPFTLAGGAVDAAADLTATGYTPAAWLATLAGNASLTAHAGTLTGFNLPGLRTALTAPKNRASQMRAASLTGATPFTALNITATLNSGIVSLNQASLQAPSGTATAIGDIDLPDTGITLTLMLVPNVQAPPKLTLTLAGNWQMPRQIAALKPALTWKPPGK
jgi:uncharacterized protein involved in outer membrane biogenesis